MRVGRMHRLGTAGIGQARAWEGPVCDGTPAGRVAPIWSDWQGSGSGHLPGIACSPEPAGMR